MSTPVANGAHRRLQAWNAFGLAAALTCIGWAWIPLTVSVPNERSRVFLTMALYERGAISIDAEVARFGGLADIARVGEHYYCDKAPGTSLLGVPVYAIARALRPASFWTDSDVLQLLRWALMLPIALLGLFALPRLLRKLSVSDESAALTTVAWPLATIALHYAGALYGHHLVAVALVVGLALVLCMPSLLGLALAGLSTGIAGLIEYQAAPACILIALWVAYAFRARPWLVVAFALGALPSVLVLGAYNTAAFGGPLEVSYNHIGNPGMAAFHNHGIGGVDTPKLEAVLGLLISVHRGLFKTAPIMLLVLPGLVLLFQRERALGISVAGMLLAYLLFMSGFDTWWAGWSFGPRLLVPLFGVAMIPIAFALDRLRTSLAGACIVGSFLLLGFAQSAAMRATFFEAPDTLFNPVFELAAPALRANLCAPSIGHALGLSGCAAHLPMLALGLCALLGLWWLWAAQLRLRSRALAALLAVLLATGGLWAISTAPGSSAQEQRNVMQFLQSQLEAD